MTAAFVVECDRVRRRHYDLLTPNDRHLSAVAAAVRMVEGPPETRTNYWRRAVDAREITRRQTPIWQELKKLLGDRMGKPTLELLETDALIERAGEIPVLIEIKTDSRASSIQQGFGQLLLYSGIYRRHPDGGSVELVLLLPESPRAELKRVLTDHRIIVATYEGGDPPVFDPEFLALCRVQ
jgi:hypothetical protein